MATSPDRIYWDSCTWIALIQREKVTLADGTVEDRGAMCRNIIGAAFAGQYEIATCGITLAEVCKDPRLEHPKTVEIRDFFEHEFILLVNVDYDVGAKARALMNAGYSKLRPADACHVAAAALSLSNEMHTFDDKILALDGLIDKPDGAKLKICKPGQGGTPMPLFQVVASR